MKGKYRLPTVSGGLRVNEISQIAQLFYEEKNWKTVSTIYYETNISQTSKRTTASRYFSYMKSLISSWTEEELEAFINSSFDEKKSFIWLAFCREYPIGAEFASKAIREKVISGQLEFSLNDFRTFISKLVDSGRMEEPTYKVFSEGRINIYKMLRELGYYNGETLQGCSLSSDFIKLVYMHNPEELHYFPLSDQAIKRGLTA